MDRDVTRRNDGTEQGSANIFLCGLPPSPNIPLPDLPDFNFPGFNTTLLYVAPPDKREEVRFFNHIFLKPILFSNLKSKEYIRPFSRQKI